MWVQVELRQVSLADRELHQGSEPLRLWSCRGFLYGVSSLPALSAAKSNPPLSLTWCFHQLPNWLWHVHSSPHPILHTAAGVTLENRNHIILFSCLKHSRGLPLLWESLTRLSTVQSLLVRPPHYSLTGLYVLRWGQPTVICQSNPTHSQ